MSDPSRRDVLRLAGTVVVASACGDNAATKPAGATSASAVFEPTSSGFLVSAWSQIETGVMQPKQYLGVMLPFGGAPLTPDKHRAVAAYVYTLANPAKK